MVKEDRFRGTGRTSRMLIQALSMAGEGKTVLVIAANSREIGAMMALTTTLPEFKALTHAKLAMPSNEVTLWPQGQIRFVSAQDPQWSWSRRHVVGYPVGQPTLIDHHAEELYEYSIEGEDMSDYAGLKQAARRAELAVERKAEMERLRIAIEDGLLDPKQVLDTVRDYLARRGVTPPPEVAPAPTEEVERRHGVKLDAGKSPVWRGFIQYFPRAMEEIAIVSMEGCAEPGHVWGGWKSVMDGYARYSDAMARHQLEEAKLTVPLDVVEQRKLIKACATVGWNDMARLEHLIEDFTE